MTSITKNSGQGFPGGFTVLMSVYGQDDSELFGKAIASVYGNELKPDQMVLVVDGPIPPAIEQQIRFSERNHGTMVVRLETNRGLAEALNAGLTHINTEWVVRADADDYNLPQRFGRISDLLNTQVGLDLIGSAILELERDGTPVAKRVMPICHEDISKFLLRRNPFNHMTVAYRRSFVEKCGGYPNIYLKEDYALWAVMIKSGARCANLPDVLVHATAGRDMYRRRGGLRYARSEMDLQAFMIRLGLKSSVRGILDGFARSSVFLAPSSLRRWIYEQFLRTR